MNLRCTVEPPFNGQFGDFYFVLYTEVSFTRRFSSSGTGNANLRLYKTQNCFREDVLRNPQILKFIFHHHQEAIIIEISVFVNLNVIKKFCVGGALNS